MMTLGRLRAIESYWARRGDDAIGGVGKKHTAELIAEVRRLRDALTHIASLDSDRHPLCPHRCCEDARDALREPDLGPPDIVCRRAGITET